jgi:hypothetical protein
MYMFVHFLSVAFIWKSTVDHDRSILPGTEISIIRRGKIRTNVLLTLLYTVYTLQRHNREILKHIFQGQELRGFSPSERFTYSSDRSVYSAAGQKVVRMWEYIDRSQTHECGNWV